MQQKNKANYIKILSARILGLIISFILPVFLSRELEVEEYGIYKQIILVWNFFLQIIGIGLDLSMAYFIKRLYKYSSTISINISIVSFISTFILIGLFYFINSISNSYFIKITDINLLIWLTSLIAISGLTHHMEYFFIVKSYTNKAILTEILTQITKVIATISFVLNSYTINYFINFMVLIYVVRFIFFLSFHIREIDKRKLKLKLFKKIFITQAHYSLDLAKARLLTAICYYDKLIIASLVSVKEFTIYSVGCFEIPFIYMAVNTAWDLYSLGMINEYRDNHKRFIKSWKNLNTKIAIFVIPTLMYVCINSSEIITLIFSSKYAKSAYYFSVFSIMTILNSFDAEIIYRVTNENNIFYKIKKITSIISILTLLTSTYLFGIDGAIWSKFFTTVVYTYFSIKEAIRVTKTKWQEIIDLKIVVNVTALMICIIAIKLLLKYLSVNKTTSMSLTFFFSVMILIAVVINENIINKNDISNILKIFTRVKTNGKRIQ